MLKISGSLPCLLLSRVGLLRKGANPGKQKAGKGSYLPSKMVPIVYGHSSSENEANQLMNER